jgi:hypothetical protein
VKRAVTIDPSRPRALQGSVDLIAIGDGFALDAERPKVALADRGDTAFTKYLAHRTLGLVVEHQFVDVLGTGGVKIWNL